MKLPTIALILALGATLGACREQEQNRQLSLEKGGYQGTKDTTLDDEQRRQLRERSLLGH